MVGKNPQKILGSSSNNFQTYPHTPTHTHTELIKKHYEKLFSGSKPQVYRATTLESKAENLIKYKFSGTIPSIMLLR